MPTQNPSNIFPLRSLALPDPVLHALPHALHLLLRHRQAHLAVRLARLHKVPHALRHAQVVVAHDGVLLLPAPDEVADVLRRARHDVVRRRHAREDRRHEAHEDVAVARHDRPRHRRHQHVDPARQQLLVALCGRRQRADRGCHVVLGGQGARHPVVDRLLGRRGVAVQEEARLRDLRREAVGGGRRGGDDDRGKVLLFLRLVGLAGRGRRRGRGDLADGGLGGGVVDGLALALGGLLGVCEGGGGPLGAYHSG